MLAIERREKILEALKRDKKVLVGELSRQFDVSEETIRRDLDRLEKDGAATKTYGGAYVNESVGADLPYVVRKNTNIDEKNRIATLCERLISDGDRIMLDGSSTTVYIANHIKNKKNLTLITNSVEVILAVSDISGMNILCTGGKLKEGSLAFLGRTAEDMLEKYHVDKAFVSCKGLDTAKGVTDSDEGHATVKRIMLQNASRRYLAVDSTKFDRISFTQLCDVCDFDAIVTDREPSETWKTYFAERQIEVLFPTAEETL